MPTYKLYYFNRRGRAEVARLIFAAAGQQFVDIRYERNEWPLHKVEMPLGKVPVLEVDGQKIPQSLSIARFLARQFQLSGKDNFAEAKVDAIVDTISDTMVDYIPARLEEDEAKREELIRKFFDNDLPEHLHRLEILGKLYGNNGPFFVDNQLTWADLLFYDVAETFLRLDENCLENHAWLKQIREEVEKLPRIAEYLENRPKHNIKKIYW